MKKFRDLIETDSLFKDTVSRVINKIVELDIEN